MVNVNKKCTPCRYQEELRVGYDAWWTSKAEYEQDCKLAEEIIEERIKFPLFYWRDTCMPLLNIRTGKIE